MADRAWQSVLAFPNVQLPVIRLSCLPRALSFIGRQELACEVVRIRFRDGDALFGPVGLHELGGASHHGVRTRAYVSRVLFDHLEEDSEVPIGESVAQK